MDAVSPQPRLAVLIDADNAQPALAGALLAEVAKYGRATTKRAYGNWTTTNLVGWKKVLSENAIQPMQQFPNTIGKNATDSALIIDAMDLLYTARFDGFCIVSSDSDFTRLASRIRESGLTVYGFGEQKTPQAFVTACDKFVYVEVLRSVEDVPTDTVEASHADDHRSIAPVAAGPQTTIAPKKTTANAKPATAKKTAPKKVDPKKDGALLRLLRAALDDAADDDGWAALGAVGNLIGKRMPAFDARNYGFKKLSDLVAGLSLFEIEKRGADGRPKAIYLREKRSGAKPKS